MHLIAIIDDDSSVLSGLEGLVRSFGYSVLSFASGQDFLQAPEIDRIACVVTDVQMPGLSGLDLQRLLKKTHPALPVVFITAFPGARVQAEALRAGAFGFLSKPFEARDLARCLETACMGRRSPGGGS